MSKTKLVRKLVQIAETVLHSLFLPQQKCVGNYTKNFRKCVASLHLSAVLTFLSKLDLLYFPEFTLCAWCIITFYAALQQKFSGALQENALKQQHVAFSPSSSQLKMFSLEKNFKPSNSENSVASYAAAGDEGHSSLETTASVLPSTGSSLLPDFCTSLTEQVKQSTFHVMKHI